MGKFYQERDGEIPPRKGWGNSTKKGMGKFHQESDGEILPRKGWGNSTKKGMGKFHQESDGEIPPRKAAPLVLEVGIPIPHGYIDNGVQGLK
jgi:hypothetical protein